MNRFGICLVVFAILPFLMEVDASSSNAGPCECGAFLMQPDVLEPIIERRLSLGLPCNAWGTATCQNLCLNVVKAAESQGPDVVCQLLGAVDSVIVGIKAKICDQEWVFTGHRSEFICCVDGKSVVCN